VQVLTHPTRFERTTVATSWRCILKPLDRGATEQRRVQLFIPSSPSIYVLCYPDPQLVEVDDAGRPVHDANGHTIPAEDIAKAAGYDRTYKGVLAPSATQLAFNLLPDQHLWACCDINIGIVGMLIETFQVVNPFAQGAPTMVALPPSQAPIPPPPKPGT
jgi:hypothetical protein